MDSCDSPRSKYIQRWNGPGRCAGVCSYACEPFHKINVDPAVTSGSLITTVNDLVAVVTYYGLAWLLLVECLHFA